MPRPGQHQHIVSDADLATFAAAVAERVNAPLFDGGSRRCGVSIRKRACRRTNLVCYADIRLLDRHGRESTYAIVDLLSGNVHRPASGRAVDPVPRGNLIDPVDPSHGVMALGTWGVRYLDDEVLDDLVLWRLRLKYAPETMSDQQRAHPPALHA